MLQPRLKKFIQQPDRLPPRQLTDKSLAAIATVERYRFLTSSLLVRLMAGNQRNNHRQLQTLFHSQLLNRCALANLGTPGAEFIYYLDNSAAIDLLVTRGLLPGTPEEIKRKRDLVATNRSKNYSKLLREIDSQGKFLYLQHELMISRFHAMLELACRKLSAGVDLVEWKQGAELWHRVEVPKTREERGRTIELDETEYLPHRPDAFFGLRFPGKPEGEQLTYFLYEADRATENTTRIKTKLRAHYHFIVKQRRQRTTACYKVPSIRAVLIETPDMHWAENLRDAARHPTVSPKPSPLFWFTPGVVFSQPSQTISSTNQRPTPMYLDEPEIIFRRIWATPVEDTFLGLAD